MYTRKFRSVFLLTVFASLTRWLSVAGKPGEMPATHRELWKSLHLNMAAINLKHSERCFDAVKGPPSVTRESALPRIQHLTLPAFPCMQNLT